MKIGGQRKYFNKNIKICMDLTLRYLYVRNCAISILYKYTVYYVKKITKAFYLSFLKGTD